MKRIVVILLAAVIAAPALAGEGPQSPLAGPAEVRVSGTSTLHDWTVASRTIEGSLTVSDAFLVDPTLASAPDLKAEGPVPGLTVVIPATSLKSDSPKMDKVMHEALAAAAHPQIRFALTGASLASGADPASGAFRLDVRGQLTVAGQTREVAFPVDVQRRPSGQLVVTGEVPLKMTTFGIKPPTALLGTVRSGDDIRVTFLWEVTPTPRVP